jgi:hypothetical protein
MGGHAPGGVGRHTGSSKVEAPRTQAAVPAPQMVLRFSARWGLSHFVHPYSVLAALLIGRSLAFQGLSSFGPFRVGSVIMPDISESGLIHPTRA